MRLQDERIPPPHTAIGQFYRTPSNQGPGSGPVVVTSPPPQAMPAPPSSSGNDSLPPGPFPADEELPGTFQDAHIRAILRVMSLGHLALGALLTLTSICIGLIVSEPAFYGLAASGCMLATCGLITLLAAQRQRSSQSPLAFYLLPYADFAIVGLWLLLFGTSGPVMLFYAYVIVSAALLLGSRHAIALTVIAGATILAMSLEQYQDRVMPAITLSHAGQMVFTGTATALALALIAYVARLFSLNLDRFIALTNRQKDQVLHARRHIANQQEQTRETMEYLSNTYVRFISGDLEARAPAPLPNSPLAFATHLLNTLLDQLERQSRAWAARANLEERIGELSQALDSLTNGDAAALQALSNPTGTPLDKLTMALGRVGRQLVTSQQALKQAIGSCGAVLGIARDLSLLHQTLGSTDDTLRDLHKRAAQSTVHLHALLEGESGSLGSRSLERPALREIELRAHQQSAGLELLHARLGHIGAQMQAIEAELRRVAESVEHITKVSRSLPAEKPGTYDDAKMPNAPGHPTSGPIQPSDNISSAASTPARPPSGALKPTNTLPRRFTGPVIPPGRPPAERSGPWQVPLENTAPETSHHPQ